MSIHGGTWRVHASAVDDIELISSAMIWMVGGDEGISINSYKSAHGGRMATIIAKMNRKSALFSLKRFGNEQLGMMAEEIREKIDEDSVRVSDDGDRDGQAWNNVPGPGQGH